MLELEAAIGEVSTIRSRTDFVSGFCKAPQLTANAKQQTPKV